MDLSAFFCTLAPSSSAKSSSAVGCSIIITFLNVLSVLCSRNGVFADHQALNWVVLYLKIVQDAGALPCLHLQRRSGNSCTGRGMSARDALIAYWHRPGDSARRSEAMTAAEAHEWLKDRGGCCMDASCMPASHDSSYRPHDLSAWAHLCSSDQGPFWCTCGYGSFLASAWERQHTELMTQTGS